MLRSPAVLWVPVLYWAHQLVPLHEGQLGQLVQELYLQALQALLHVIPLVPLVL